jgi:hypothetical protein
VQLSTAFYFLLTAVGNGAMNKFGNPFQWRSQLFKPRMLCFSVGHGAMKAPRYWELRDEACSAVETKCEYTAFYLWRHEFSWPCWQLGTLLATAVRGGTESSRMDIFHTFFTFFIRNFLYILTLKRVGSESRITLNVGSGAG